MANSACPLSHPKKRKLNAKIVARKCGLARFQLPKFCDSHNETAIFSKKPAKTNILSKPLTHNHLQDFVKSNNSFDFPKTMFSTAICRILQGKNMGFAMRSVPFGKAKTMLLAFTRTVFGIANVAFSTEKASKIPFCLSISPIPFVKYFYRATENSYRQTTVFVFHLLI